MLLALAFALLVSQQQIGVMLGVCLTLVMLYLPLEGTFVFFELLRFLLW
jgi:hypothetical protein